MSEYQFYEFMAIDRPLTAGEIRTLGSHSTRAWITPMGFTNHYEWGDFKGDEDKWMGKYFDAFLYLANWGTHVLKLRLPSTLLSLKTAEDYCTCDEAYAWEREGRVIVSFASNEEEGDEDDWGEGRLAEIVPVRADIARGDMRALYLGWLSCVETGELDDDELEPPVPPNLKDLTEPLERFADFLRVNDCLLAAAASVSPTVEVTPLDKGALAAWLAALPQREKDEMLLHVIEDENARVGRELVTRFENERRLAEPAAAQAGGPARRTVAELLRAADELRQIDERKQAEEKARLEREALAAREKYLDELARREPEVWAQVERLIAATQPKSYDEAMPLLKDLRDLAARRGTQDFQARIETMRAKYPRRPALLARLKKLGM